MYIKGIPDYSRDGKQKETGLFAGLVSQDGELKQTQNGKEFGSASVRAFNRKDGTAAFMTIKSFGDYARLIANLRKGDHILCAGVISEKPALSMRWVGAARFSAGPGASGMASEAIRKSTSMSV